MKENVEQLLQLIRGLDMAWLEKELVETISAGKLQQKEIQDGKTKSFGVEQVSYTAKEQFDIIISTLNNYFIILPEIEVETLKILTKNLISKDFELIENAYYQNRLLNNDTQKLKSLLTQLKKL